MKRFLQIIIALGILASIAFFLLPAKSKTVEGVLIHNSQSVRTVEAWLGHEFMVGDTPILPTAEVPASELEKLVGSKVKVKGIWNPGEKIKSTPEDELMARPEGFEREVAGEGIEVKSVAKL